jgi:serine/threonine protein kinase
VVTPEGVSLIMDTAMYLISCPSGSVDDGGVRWRAPEMLAPPDGEANVETDIAPVTTQSDIYSLGVTLYEVCVLCLCNRFGRVLKQVESCSRAACLSRVGPPAHEWLWR